MPSVIANGIRQNYELLPPREPVTDPQTIVCIHGILIDSLASYFFTLAQPLHDAGYRVVLYDLRGHGNTDRPAAGYRLDDFVEDLAALLDHLGVESAYVLGNSFGGTIAYGFAARHPDRAAGVMTIESEPATPQWAAKMAANLHRAATELGTVKAMTYITATYGRGLAHRSRGAYRMLCTTTLERDLPDSTVLSDREIAAIGCPSLAVYGSESDLSQLAEPLRILMPRHQAIVLPGLEHSVLVEAPAKVLDLLLSWMDQQRHAAPRERSP
ncbi:MAG: alpha/beta hydrolase [Catenulisporales bacterium]|nr:alpha/beta hydrolase [Catenulisporales bacterium]